MIKQPWDVPTAWRGLEQWLGRVLSPAWRERQLRVVEIGTDWGYSFWQLLQLFPKATVFSIDPYGPTSEGWAGPQGREAEKHVQRWAARSRRAKMVKMTAVGAAKAWFAEFGGLADFLHIDGRHDYDSVKADFEAWLPLVRDGGMIACHDTVSHAATVGRFLESILREDEGLELAFETTDYYGMRVLRVNR